MRSQETIQEPVRFTDPDPAGADGPPVVLEVDRVSKTYPSEPPVTALLARSGGGYAVEVVAGDGTHHLVRVTPGLFDDVAGMVQVSGAGLRAGQHVVVPGE